MQEDNNIALAQLPDHNPSTTQSLAGNCANAQTVVGNTRRSWFKRLCDGVRGWFGRSGRTKDAVFYEIAENYATKRLLQGNNIKEDERYSIDCAGRTTYYWK